MDDKKQEIKDKLKQLKNFKDLPIYAMQEVKLLNEYIAQCEENILTAKTLLQKIKLQENDTLKAYNDIMDGVRALSPLEQQIVEMRYVKCYSWVKMEMLLHFNQRTLQLYHSDILIKLYMYYQAKNTPS